MPEHSPFTVIVVSELAAHPEYSTRGGRRPDLVRIDKSNLDAFFADVAPSLAFDVRSPPSGRNERIDVRFASLRDFRPKELVERIPLLAALYDAFRAVGRAARRELSSDALQRELTRLLPEGSFRDAMLRSCTSPAAAPSTATPPSAATPPISSDGALDRLLSQVDLAPSTVSAPPPAGGLEQAQAELGRTLVALLTAVIEHPEVKRLEAAWRGLWSFVKDADAHGVALFVLDGATPESALDDLRALHARDREFSPDLVLVDHVFASSAREAELAEAWAALGEQLLAPVLAAAHPSLFGANDLAELARAERSWGDYGDPRAVYLRALSAKDVSRWLALTINRVLARTRWERDSSRLGELPSDALGTEVWSSGAYVVGALAARSFVRFGFGSALTGPDHGKLSDRPVRIVDDRGHEYALPVEVFVSSEAQTSLGYAGVIALGSARNHDAVIVTSAPVVFRGETVHTGSNVRAELGLGDQLFVSRLARAIEQLAAALPKDVREEDAQQVTHIALAELLQATLPPGPEIQSRVRAGKLEVTVRPGRFPGVRLPEITLAAKLGDDAD